MFYHVFMALSTVFAIGVYSSKIRTHTMHWALGICGAVRNVSSQEDQGGDALMHKIVVLSHMVRVLMEATVLVEVGEDGSCTQILRLSLGKLHVAEDSVE